MHQPAHKEYASTERPSAYIPMDRRLALIRGETLPERTFGTAIFADISGFTPLTEALSKTFGAKRGAEVLTQHLNQVYDALITKLHLYGGSVMGFAGDAITCWIDQDDGRQAINCAIEMQHVMSQFKRIDVSPTQTASLAMKIGIATGEVSRFLVGDRQIQILDILAGSTLEELSLAEKHAEKGDVVLAPSTYASVGDLVEVGEWRTADDGQQYAVVKEWLATAAETPWPLLEEEQFRSEQTRPWLLAPVYERLHSQQGEFLAELRPAVALFLNFSGIDYDHDPKAGSKLNSFISQVQHITNRYEGAVLQVTIGDKGSFFYAAFGAPIAHEDDLVRAIAAALDYRDLIANLSFLDAFKIGITVGRMRTGAYGGSMRRTYGVIGDVVNLAARLMQAAEPGQILTTQGIAVETSENFQWLDLGAIQVKGKTEPIDIAEIQGRHEAHLQIQEIKYALPLVGRKDELQLFQQKLSAAGQNQGQIVGITAEAGMGKSRLVAEMMYIAQTAGFQVYAGECLSYATDSSYFVWQNIWRHFFNLDSSRSVAQQIQQLENALTDIDPTLLPRLPLLSAVVGLPLPDSSLTSSFDAKLRKLSLESLLVDCVRHRAKQQPLCFILEDSHWLDALSHDLLEVLSRAIADQAVMLLFAYRPFTVARLQTPRVSQLGHFTEIELAEFTPDEAQQLIRLKLEAFADPHTTTDSTPSDELLTRITERAGGNPFYIEELVNYLRDRGIDPHDLTALEQLELPDSLHSLILSRIDQLTEQQKSILKVASVIGRLFRAAMVWGVYPQLGDYDQIINNLNTLSHLDLTPLDSEPESLYLFKHVITQEVAYENLPFAMRATLHEQIGNYIEHTYADNLDQYTNLLAFHYERGRDEDKKREYLLKAGQQAQKTFANDAAISYYERALPLLVVTEKGPIIRQMGEILQLVGRWKEAETQYKTSLQLAQSLNDEREAAWVQATFAEYFRKQGEFEQAAERLALAQEQFEQLGEQAGLGRVLKTAGTVAIQQGNLEKAKERYTQSLHIHQALQDNDEIANILNNLGILARYQGNLAEAQTLYEQSLAIRRELGNKSAVANSLNNLGLLTLHQGDRKTAQSYLEQALTLQREVGDTWAIANLLNNLGNVAREQGEYAEAQQMYQESLQINRDLGAIGAITYLFEDIAALAVAQNQMARALMLFSMAAKLRTEIGAPLSPADQDKVNQTITAARSQLPAADQAHIWQEGQQKPRRDAIEYALQSFG